MMTVSYDPKSGDFRYSIEENISDEAIKMLKKIQEAKESFTWDTLAAERDLLWDQGDEKASDMIQHQIHIMTSLEEFGLVKQVPIHHERQIKDMAFKTTYLGNVVLNIREKKL